MFYTYTWNTLSIIHNINLKMTNDIDVFHFHIILFASMCITYKRNINYLSKTRIFFDILFIHFIINAITKG